MPEQSKATLPPVKRTIAGLQSALFDEIDNIRSGNGDMQRVRAVAQVTGRVNELIHAEVKVRRLIGAESGETTNLKNLLR